MAGFYNLHKKHNQNQLTKNKMDIEKWKNHPPSIGSVINERKFLCSLWTNEVNPKKVIPPIIKFGKEIKEA